jgi:hypothetical protein
MKAEVKFQVRLPVEIRDALARDAINSHRSMNGQVIAILRAHFRAIGMIVGGNAGGMSEDEPDPRE